MVLQWRVLKKAKVKAGVELDSEKVASLGVGAVVTALEQQGNRVRCSEGWISILAESGAVLLHDMDVAIAAAAPPQVDAGVGEAGSTRRDSEKFEDLTKQSEGSKQTDEQT